MHLREARKEECPASIWRQLGVCLCLKNNFFSDNRQHRRLSRLEGQYLVKFKVSIVGGAPS